MNENQIESSQAIKDQIEITRESLVQKIHTLESDITDTYEGAKNTVNDTINDVKSAFDIKKMYSKNPVMFISGSLLLGYFAAKLFKKQSNYIEHKISYGENKNFVEVLKEETGQEIKRLARNALGLTVDSLNSAIKERTPSVVHQSLDNISNKLKTNYSNQY